jgi:hypothetical protein
MDTEQQKVWDILSTPHRQGIKTVKPVFAPLFVLTGTSSGIHPDYKTRYERRTKESLGYIKDSTETAE